jgi:hypothetical protein
MRTPWLMALAALGLLAGEAHAQAYQYVATTTAPAARTGAVTAGNLTWQCTGSECRISGPWPAPGVGACALLAGQVGRIASYGRSGAMLNAAQLAECNANLPVAQMQITPQVAIARPQAQLPQAQRPQAQLPQTAVINRAPSSSTPSTSTPPPAARTSEVALEYGGGGEDLVVHVLSTPAIRFYGASPALTAPTPPAPVSRIVGGRIDSPGVRLQASTVGAVPRSSTQSEAPRYGVGIRGDVVLRVPVSLRDLPPETRGIELNCALFASRFVPFVERERVAGDPDGTGPMAEPVAGTAPFYSSGARAGEREVAFGMAAANIVNLNNFSATFDVPLQLRPFFRLQDARQYMCDVTLTYQRPGGRTGHIDRGVLYVLAGPSGPAGFRPAAGSTPLLTVEGNIQ